MGLFDMLVKQDVNRIQEDSKITDLSKINYKFSEDKSMHLIQDHIDATYDAHYSENKFQATEFILDSGHGTGFCMGNILKYAQRYGKKGTKEDHRKDLMKIIHYAIIQLHVHDLKKIV